MIALRRPLSAARDASCTSNRLLDLNASVQSNPSSLRRLRSRLVSIYSELFAVFNRVVLQIASVPILHTVKDGGSQ